MPDVVQPADRARRIRRVAKYVAAALLGALSAVGALPLESVAALQVALGAL